ncbi:Transcriptional regulator [Oleispira antarctica RB-8]|uniref:Transcriptional regulator n=1 Tax=Oleispira antarctica RB-8 TaxID=698738 RepID=R4YLB9_OLEAN|nr:Transcriptional regulator [Oleispira antarctica RB-8]|tara:strand:- start:508 stop:1182 length:675 start_codon:yes stop_codon:yes gene_type:complete
MARRKDHSPEELKAWVITSVLEFLQQQPAQALSLRQIAKMVSYSPGTLINLFGSYAHLLLAVNACTLDQISELLEKKLSDADNLNAQQQLLLFAQEYLLFAQQHTFQWRLLFEHRLDEDVPDWQQSRINQLFELIELRLLKLSPQAKPNELQQASRTVWASVHGICMLEVDNKIFASTSNHYQGVDGQVVDRQAVNGGSMIHSLIHHYLTSWKTSIDANITINQ